MPLFGPPNVEKLKEKRDVKGLIKALGYRKRPSVQMAAAWALGQIGDARAVEPLVAVLQDEDHHEPLFLVVAILGQFNNIPSGLPIKARENVSRHVLAAWALGQIGDARAVEPLVAALKPDVHVIGGYRLIRVAVARALGQTGDARAIEPLVALLDHFPDAYAWEDIAATAIEALEKIAGVRAAGPLARYIGKGGYMSSRAVKALQKMLETNASSISEEDLRAIAAIQDITEISRLAWHPNCSIPFTITDREAADCILVRQFARQELIRRERRA